MKKTVEKSFQLPKEFGEKWLKALRSGDYQQTSDVLLEIQYEYDASEEEPDYIKPLHDTCKYCCLGVAAKIQDADWLSIAGVELLDSDPLLFIELGVPSELTVSCSPSKYNMVDVLTSLNDQFTEITYKKSLEAFPNLQFRKEIEFKSRKRIIDFSFEDIADFIEDNTKFI